MLTLTGVTVYYGAIRALDGVDLTVEAGEIVAMIGANGAGKSTTISCISGLVRARSGSVWFDGEDVEGLATHERVERGICQSPEGRRVFANLSVNENLDLGAYIHHRQRSRVEADRERVFGLFPRLKERSRQPAGTLSGGEQQMLAIGRALMGRPRLLMLDEPSLGLAPVLVRQIFEIVRDINRQGVTILLVEQNAYQALHVASRAYVLETGRVVMAGPANELLHDRQVREAYLGE
ncbi:MAG TPA: ABC transporter ATP-binding protein [Chthonomonadales bacterium]|nr:ABC transporter ATP-binding protein [Chthonomonadales bacterium]